MIGSLLRLPHEVIVARMLAALNAKGFDISPTELGVFLYPGPEGRRPIELARQCHMTRQAMNYVLAGLERRGYIERHTGASRGRTGRADDRPGLGDGCADTRLRRRDRAGVDRAPGRAAVQGVARDPARFVAVWLGQWRDAQMGASTSGRVNLPAAIAGRVERELDRLQLRVHATVKPSVVSNANLDRSEAARRRYSPAGATCPVPSLDKTHGRCDDFSPAGARKVDVMPSFTLNVNGEPRTVEVRDPDEPLLYVLRNSLSLTGAKFGCGLGQCGACTVIVDNEAVRSCRMPVSKAAGKKITTIEGLGTPDKPHPLQAAFVAEQAAQCGYCVTGMVMTGAAALARKPNLSREDAQQALAGNLCRCGTHDRILRAMLRASGKATA